MLTQGVLTAAYAAQVCAYANNQWDLSGEIQEDLRQTSFYRAMVLAKVLSFTVLVLALTPLVVVLVRCAGHRVHHRRAWRLLHSHLVLSLALTPSPSVCCSSFIGCVWGVV